MEYIVAGLIIFFLMVVISGDDSHEFENGQHFDNEDNQPSDGVNWLAALGLILVIILLSSCQSELNTSQKERLDDVEQTQHQVILSTIVVRYYLWQIIVPTFALVFGGAIVWRISSYAALSALAFANKVKIPDAAPITYSPSSVHSPTLTYSPSVRYQNQIEGAQAIPMTERVVPDFGELLTKGVIGSDLGGILLGFDEQQKPIKKSFARLGSVLICGMSNVGKTVTLSSFVSQLALQDCQLLVADPHGGGGKPDCLRNRLTPFETIYAKPVAVKSAEITNQAKWIHNELIERRENGKEGKRIAWIVDELSSVLRTEAQADVKKTLLGLAQEGRGFGMYAFAICHHPKASSIGTDVRDSFPISIVHRLKRKTANLLGVAAEEAELVSNLPVGHFWLDDGVEQTVLAVPLVNDQHVEAVAQRLNSPSNPFSAPSQPLLTVGKETKREGAPISKHEGEIIEALKRGQSQSAIIQDIFGVKGGAKYQKAAQQITAIIAKHIK